MEYHFLSKSSKLHFINQFLIEICHFSKLFGLFPDCSIIFQTHVKLLVHVIYVSYFEFCTSSDGIFVFQQNYPGSDPHERTSLLHGELVEDDIKPPPYFSGKEPYLCV